jgi:hypothetical protein
MGLRPDARLLSRPTRDGPEGEPIRSRPSPRCLSFRGAGLRPCHLRQPSFTDKSFAPVLLRKPQLPVLGLIGAPQLAAILVLGQRGLEELYSARNTRALLVAGSREVGSAYYPVVAATHLAWIASLFFLIPPDALSLAAHRLLCRAANPPLLDHRQPRRPLPIRRRRRRNRARRSAAPPPKLVDRAGS